jgi:hypothetical protein
MVFAAVTYALAATPSAAGPAVAVADRGMAGGFWLPTYGKVNSVPGMLMQNAGILGSRAHGCVWLTDGGGIHAAL